MVFVIESKQHVAVAFQQRRNKAYFDVFYWIKLEILITAVYVVAKYSSKLISIHSTPTSHAVFETLIMRRSFRIAFGHKCGENIIAGIVASVKCLDTKIVVAVGRQVVDCDRGGRAIVYRYFIRPIGIGLLFVLVFIACD